MVKINSVRGIPLSLTYNCTALIAFISLLMFQFVTCMWMQYLLFIYCFRSRTSFICFSPSYLGWKCMSGFIAPGIIVMTHHVWQHARNVCMSVCVGPWEPSHCGICNRRAWKNKELSEKESVCQYCNWRMLEISWWAQEVSLWFLNSNLQVTAERLRFKKSHTLSLIRFENSGTSFFLCS